jgi:wyosine [tRNA(Phe)-imidazoG37] synthetase (radical SAM superfamily)
MTSNRTPLFVHRDHRRDFAANRYVYAVVSRRSKGVSVGVNLNPDKVCNFDCVYCQVDRTTPGDAKDVDLARLSVELEEMLDLIASGELFRHERFSATPLHLRRLNDIAFSGDGEPTTCPVFVDVVRVAAAARAARGLNAVKLVLITNATQFHRPRVREALALMAANNGEVWAKLDAGTDAYYHLIERTTVPFDRVLSNIAETAKAYPLVIQAMFLRLSAEPPSPAEQEAFCERLNEVLQSGGRISRVQVYTVARKPAEPTVTPLSDAEVDALAALVRRRTGLDVEAYYGV